jgi:hypothetical protein
MGGICLAVLIGVRTPCDFMIIKSFNWFIVALLTATLIVFHYPVPILSSVFLFPLLHNSLPFITSQSDKPDSKKDLSFKERLSGFLFFSFWAVIGIVTLLGTHLLAGWTKSSNLVSLIQGNLWKLRSLMMAAALEKSECDSSNLWIYLCLILVPNLLVMTKVQWLS